MNLQIVPHLRCHSEYSLTHGMIRLDGDAEVGKLAAERGIGAVALTDTNNIHAAIRFQASCLRHGVKPLLGCLVSMQRDLEHFHATLLCLDTEGFTNLSRLLSDAQLNNNGSVDAGKLSADNTAGLLMLNGYEGDAATALRTGQVKQAQQRLAQWREVLGPERCCCELSFGSRDREDTAMLKLNELAAGLGIASVATHPVMFADHKDFAAHDVRTCIANHQKYDDPERVSAFSPSQYLWSAQELREHFASWPDALANAQEIAQRCNYDFGVTDVPQFPRLAAAKQSAAQILRTQAKAGLASRISATRTSAKQYHERLERELQIIIDKGFADYFLIVAEFVAYAKSNDIPVGPGRGSGAGSLVAYSLGITGFDPLEYGLLFERFLNPERTELPDFDIDFCKQHRDDVITHVQNTYGHDCVAQVVTFGTLKAKAVVRDVARVLGMPYSTGEQISRLIPDELNISLTKARNDNPKLDDFLNSSAELQQLWDFSMALEGLPRQASTHAAAILIAPRPLVEFCPVTAIGEAHERRIVSQYDMDAVAKIGLIKFDFLGLRNLTALHKAELAINAGRTGRKKLSLIDTALSGGKELNEAFALYCTGQTVGIFQCESPGMVALLQQLKPSCLDDIAVTISLFRPGVLSSNMHETYLRARNDPTQISYPHSLAAEILNSTFGVMIYQEQVMQLSQALAGFSLGKADQLRAAIGKKDANAMGRLREEFLSGSAKHLKKSAAIKLFEDISVFAGYGFNKSHAIAYALISLQTAYLKVRYPGQFYAAMLDSWDDDPANQVQLIKDALRNKRSIKEVLLPCVNVSQVDFTSVCDHKQLRFGLGSIRDVGRACAAAIVAERQRSNDFTSLDNLCTRLPAGVLNRRALESLINSGACDCLTPQSDWPATQTRAWLISAANGALEHASDLQRHSTQVALFDEEQTSACTAALPAAQQWSVTQKLAGELSALGLPLSGHFYDDVRWLCKQAKRLHQHTALLAGKQRRCWAGAVTKRITSSRLRRQGRVVFLLNDHHRHPEVEVIAEEAMVDNLRFDQPGLVVIVEGTVEQNNNRPARIKAHSVTSLAQLCAKHLRKLTCKGLPATAIDRFFAVLDTLEAGKTSIELAQKVTVGRDARRAIIDVGVRYTFTPAALNKLRALVDNEANLKLTFD